VGLIPDLATLRDRATNPVARFLYAMGAMGWRGEARHWHNYEKAYYLLAALATPLVVSVHTVVSFDFAVGVIPGWHTTIFPPYFVAGAIFSGFAMVATLAIPLRAAFGLHDFITERHLQNMAKIMLVTGMIVAYGYVMELFTAWYSANSYEQYAFLNRIQGPYRYTWFALIACNVLAAQFLWSNRIRGNTKALWVLSLIINVGMWLERFLIVIVSLHRDFLPSSWAMYVPTRFDWMTFVGTLGFFMALLFLFIRFLPMISIFEVRTLLPGSKPKEAA
jgi:molybdopterin-containing oxidoreductase family membrane subunit